MGDFPGFLPSEGAAREVTFPVTEPLLEYLVAAESSNGTHIRDNYDVMFIEGLTGENQKLKDPYMPYQPRSPCSLSL